MNEIGTYTDGDGAVIASTSQTSEELGKQFEAADAAAAEEKAQKAEKEEDARKSMPARLGQLYREKKEAERRAEEIERKAAEAQAELEHLKREREAASQKPQAPAARPEEPPDERRATEPPKRAQTAAPAPADDPEPNADDFEDYAGYVKAQARWEARQEFRAQRERAAADEAKRATYKAFQDRIEARKASDPDFFGRLDERVVELVPSRELDAGAQKGPANGLADFLIESDIPDLLIEHLYSKGNTAERDRLFSLHPIKFFAELGRLSERLGAANPTATAPAETSRAKPPARPVVGGPPTGELDVSKMSLSEYAKYREAQERRR